MIKKLVSVLLLICISLSLVSCGTENTKSKKTDKANKVETESIKSINLLYNKSDVLNPYTSVTENNRNLCRLIFEPLVKTNNDFEPILRVAKSIDINETQCVVTLIDTLFSDGSRLTANDVIYSYNLAKNSSGIYASHLYEITSAAESSSNTVVFNTSRKDPYIRNLLDFPIVKAESDKITNSDGVLNPPIGCGRYTVSEDKTNLILNKNFFGVKGPIKKINLINAPDEDSLSHYIEVGASEFYYNDFSNQDIYRMSGKKAEVNLNNLVYIGVNQNTAVLNSKELRYAISAAIDRNEICSKAYYNNAEPATGYFNPCLKEIAAVQTIKTSADSEITVENLKKIGYNSKDSDGYYVNSNGVRLVLRLLVNKENRYRVVIANQIASNLKAAGIQIDVIEATFSEYKRLIKKKSFDLYVGEVSIMPNFDMSPLVCNDGSLNYGARVKTAKTKTKEKAKTKAKTKKSKSENNKKSSNDLCTEAINSYYGGALSLSDVAATLLTEMPQIPVLYRKGLFFYKDNIVSDVESSECDIYYSIENFKSN